MQQLPSLGVSGLLFVMWWIERQERTRCQDGMQQALQHTATIAELNSRLLDVVRSNTEALTALREELSAQRRVEDDWMNRVSRVLEHAERRTP